MLATMPPPRKKAAGKRPKKQPNPNAVFLTLDDETAAALVAFLGAQKIAPERTAVIVHALRAFLVSEGFLKAPK